MTHKNLFTLIWVLATYICKKVFISLFSDFDSYLNQDEVQSVITDICRDFGINPPKYTKLITTASLEEEEL